MRQPCKCKHHDLLISKLSTDGSKDSRILYAVLVVLNRTSRPRKLNATVCVTICYIPTLITEYTILPPMSAAFHNNCIKVWKYLEVTSTRNKYEIDQQLARSHQHNTKGCSLVKFAFQPLSEYVKPQENKKPLENETNTLRLSYNMLTT